MVRPTMIMAFSFIFTLVFLAAYIYLFNRPLGNALQMAMGASVVCSCDFQKPMLIMRDALKTDNGTAFIQSDDKVLQDCSVQICNCMDEFLSFSGLELEYGTRGFKNSDYNKDYTADFKGALGTGIPKRARRTFKCKDIFKEYKDKFLSVSEDDEGVLYARLVYNGEQQGESRWNVKYRVVREVNA